MPSAVNMEHIVSEVIKKSDHREVPKFRVLHHLGQMGEEFYFHTPAEIVSEYEIVFAKRK